MKKNRSINIRIYVYHFKEDNPKKCTALKMAHFNLAKIYKRFSEVPYRIPTLDPFTENILLPSDKERIEKRGFLIPDFSWKGDIKPYLKLRKIRHLTLFRLPTLLAGNPVRWGKPFELSSIEAASAALYIIGKKSEAKEVMSLYTWGESFLTLNKEPLEAYSRVVDKKAMIAVEKEFFDDVWENLFHKKQMKRKKM